MRPFFQVVILTSLAFVAGLYVISVVAMDEGEEDAILPICDKKNVIQNETPDILLVSTLDGQLTALDPRQQGRPLWSVSTGPGPMLSSTISQLEFSNAKWVRLIPSLAGGL